MRGLSQPVDMERLWQTENQVRMEKSQGMNVSVGRKMGRRWAETSEGLVYLTKAQTFVGREPVTLLAGRLERAGVASTSFSWFSLFQSRRTSYRVLKPQVYLAWSLSEDRPQAQEFAQLGHVGLFQRLWWANSEKYHFEAGPNSHVKLIGDLGRNPQTPLLFGTHDQVPLSPFIYPF